MAVFCNTKMSCAPPGHRTTPFSWLYFESDKIWMLMKWYSLRLREGNASGEGALILMCVHCSVDVWLSSSGMKIPPNF